MFMANREVKAASYSIRTLSSTNLVQLGTYAMWSDVAVKYIHKVLSFTIQNSLKVIECFHSLLTCSQRLPQRDHGSWHPAFDSSMSTQQVLKKGLVSSWSDL